jgi:hypothetical protein
LNALAFDRNGHSPAAGVTQPKVPAQTSVASAVAMPIAVIFGYKNLALTESMEAGRTSRIGTFIEHGNPHELRRDCE